MPTGRRDTTRDRELAEAKALRDQQRATFDAKVRRVYEEGSATREIASLLGVHHEKVRKSVLRQGLREKQARPCQTGAVE